MFKLMSPISWLVISKEKIECSEHMNRYNMKSSSGPWFSLFHKDY